jgi:TorA maturation chaperone TorD
MELFRALGALCEPPNAESSRLATLLQLGAEPTSAEYTNLFVLNLYPYASVYLGPEGMLGGEGRDRIAGFWRALGMTPPAEPDHLALMLSQYAGLSELAEAEPASDRRAALERARDAYLYEHVLSWLPPYLDKVAELAAPPYAAWGRLLETALLDEATRCGAASWAEPPLALRADQLATASEPRDVDGFLARLLAPAQSGMILVHADIARAGRSLGLGLRIGERRFALRALMTQAPDAVLDWMRVEASAWAVRHAERRDTLGAIAVAWEQRARDTVQLVDTLGADLRASLGREAGAVAG